MHFRAAPPGDPVNVAVVVEEVAPGKVAGTIQGLVVPPFGPAGGVGRIFGARAGAIGVGRRFFGNLDDLALIQEVHHEHEAGPLRFAMNAKFTP